MSPLKSYRDPTRKGSSSNQHFSGSMLNFGGVVIWPIFLKTVFHQPRFSWNFWGPISRLTSATFEVVVFFSRAHLTRVMIDGKFIGRGTPPEFTKHDWLEHPTILKIYLLFKMVICLFLGDGNSQLFRDAGPKFIFPSPTRLGLYKDPSVSTDGFPLGISLSSRTAS